MKPDDHHRIRERNLGRAAIPRERVVAYASDEALAALSGQPLGRPQAKTIDTPTHQGQRVPADGAPPAAEPGDGGQGLC